MKTLKLITLFIISLLVFSCNKKKDDPQPIVQNRIEQPLDTSKTSNTNNNSLSELITFLDGKFWTPIETNGVGYIPTDSCYSKSYVLNYRLFIFDLREFKKYFTTDNLVYVKFRNLDIDGNVVKLASTTYHEQQYKPINGEFVFPQNKNEKLNITKIDSTTILLKRYDSDGNLTTYKCTSKIILRMSY